MSAHSDVSSTNSTSPTSSSISAAAETTARSFSIGLVAPLGAGALAGLAFSLSDVARARASTGPVGATTALALLGLWLWLGQMVGVASWLARRFATAIKSRLPSRVAWHVVVAVAAGAFTLLLARKVFTGAGVRRTLVGSWGAWMLPLAVAVTAWVALWIAARLVQGGWRKPSRVPTAILATCLSIGAVVLDARAPDGYLYLHVLLLTGALALATEAFELIALPVRAMLGAWALSLVTLPFLVAFPSSLEARELLAQPTWAGLQFIAYAQLRVDMDHDGHSPWFGGGDCNDSNASVFAGAPEAPGDGRDSNCDGFDDPKQSSLAFAPFRTPSLQRAQDLSELAKQYPTVVVLIDALRFDRIGNSRFPNLARLSRESLQFTRMYAVSSSTLTSVPAMMTGDATPPRNRETIAQSLGRANQQSAFIAPDVVMQTFQLGRAFDPLLGFTSRETIATDYGTGWGGGDTVTTSDQITARAVQLIDSGAAPDLLWLHYFDLHQWDILAGQGLPPRGDVGRYDAVLERMDDSLRPLLDRRGRVNVVLLADHGEGLGARGIEHHGGLVFEELAHVPFLVRVPGIEPATVDVPVSNTGVFNTLRALRGLAPDATVDQGLLDLSGATDVGNGPGFAGFEAGQWSFLYGSRRLLYTPRQQLVQLYDVARESREQKNLVDAEPWLASQMLARLFQLNNERRQ